MKNILTLLLLAIVSLQLNAQDKFYTKSGTLTFESSVPTFEEVKATNTKVTAVLKSDGNIASLALMKGFRFKIALMEEHFNENYMDSDTYPKAKFSGKIKGFSTADLTEKASTYIILGKLTLHGVTKEISITSMIRKIGDSIYIDSKFSVTPEDFNIKIPSIVRKKIAKNVDVTVAFELKKK
ncbi:MAG: YceI family protein [Flavobacteriaceae bacterium]|nr:YceI family protein [Flavobacteriaceae bacterium]